MRLRTQITLMLIAVSLSSIAGAGYITSQRFSAEQRAYLVELNSITAPNTSRSVGAFFAKLNLQLSEMDTLLRSAKSSSIPGLDTTFRQMTSVRRIEIQDDQGLVATLQHQDSPSKEFPPLEGCHTLLIPHQNSVLYCHAIGNYVYRVEVETSIFFEQISVLKALTALIVDGSGKVITGTRPQTTEYGEIVRSLASANSIVTSREIRVDGKSHFTALSPIPGLQDYFVLVQAPGTQLATMLAVALKSALPFLIAIMVIVILLGSLFSAQIVRPLEVLTQATERVAEGNWKVSLPKLSGQELNRLGHSFQQMGEELENREKALKEANHELVRAERMAVLGKFSAGVAHEVKNPLNNVLGYAQLLERKSTLSGSDQKYIGHILEETRRASRILSELLMFGRQKTPQRTAVNLNELVQQSIDSHNVRAETEGTKLLLELPEENIHLQADGDQLRQVLDNLIGNAMDALQTSSSSAIKQVHVKLTSLSNTITLEVTDNGPGIEPNNLNHIFEPFFSSKELTKGTGLGLSICHSLVTQHGGTLHAENIPGGGARFRVQLPVS